MIQWWCAMKFHNPQPTLLRIRSLMYKSNKTERKNSTHTHTSTNQRDYVKYMPFLYFTWNRSQRMKDNKSNKQHQQKRKHSNNNNKCAINYNICVSNGMCTPTETKNNINSPSVSKFSILIKTKTHTHTYTNMICIRYMWNIKWKKRQWE